MGKFNDKWLEFNTDTKGRLFTDKFSGEVFRPFQLLCKYYEEEGNDLELVQNMIHPKYDISDVPCWKDGEIVDTDNWFEKSV